MLSFTPFKADVPFHRDDSQRFLPKMIAMMMVLVTLMLLLSVSLGNTLKASSEAKTNRLTVHIPAQKNQQQVTDKTLAILHDSELISKVELLSDDTLKSQMKPWLGDMQEFDNLPLPKIIRVTWKDNNTSPDIDRISALVQPVSDTIQVEAPSEWARKYAYFTTIIQSALFALSFALLGSAAVLLMFAATTSLKLHQRAVSLLHSIGANDEYIATQFQNNAAKLAVKGAAIGSLIALGIFAIIGIYTNQLNIALLPDFTIRVTHILIAILLPIIAGGVGLATARVATLRYLKQFL